MDYFTGPWPGGRRGGFALTFDCDVTYAYTRPVAPQPRPSTGAELLAKRPRGLSGYSRGLYGLHVGLPRIERFLARHGLHATFFVPTANVERYGDEFRRLRDAGHELGAHGHEHEQLPQYRDDPAAEAAILETSLAVFRDRLGIVPAGYRSPAWDMNAHSPALLQRFGFRYDSSLFAGEAPYSMALYDPAVDIVEFPIDWSLDDAAYFLFFRPPAAMAQFHDPDSVRRIWQAELDGIVDEGGLFTLTCHPSVIGRHHRMAILEALVLHARRRGDVWIGTLAEAERHVRASRPAGALRP